MTRLAKVSMRDYARSQNRDKLDMLLITTMVEEERPNPNLTEIKRGGANVQRRNKRTDAEPTFTRLTQIHTFERIIGDSMEMLLTDIAFFMSTPDKYDY